MLSGSVQRCSLWLCLKPRVIPTSWVTAHHDIGQIDHPAVELTVNLMFQVVAPVVARPFYKLS